MATDAGFLGAWCLASLDGGAEVGAALTCTVDTTVVAFSSAQAGLAFANPDGGQEYCTGGGQAAAPAVGNGVFVSAWVRLHSGGGGSQPALVLYDNAGGVQVQIGFGADGCGGTPAGPVPWVKWHTTDLTQCFSSGDIVRSSNAPVTAGAWHHLAFWRGPWGGSGVTNLSRWWVDGVAINSDNWSSTAPPVSSVGTLYVGDDWTGQAVDVTRVALRSYRPPDDEILATYNAEKP